MKRSALTLILMAATLAGNGFGQEVWKFTSLDWEPYSGSELPNQGTSVEKLRALLKKSGITLVIDFFPWERAQQLARTAEYVGYFPAWPEEVDKGFIGSGAVDTSEVAIMKRSSIEITYDSIDELFKKYRVGIIDTYVYPAEIADAILKYPKSVEKSPDEISLVRKLSGGRTDVAITDPKVMMFVAKKVGIVDVQVVKVLMAKDLVVSFRDDSENSRRISLFKSLLK